MLATIDLHVHELCMCVAVRVLHSCAFIEKCNLPELKTRRNCLGLGLLYKIVNEDCVFPNAPLVPYTTTYFTRSQSTNTFVVPQSRTNLLQNSFFPRVISSWNSLPPHITSSSSTASFKYHLLHHITN